MPHATTAGVDSVAYQRASCVEPEVPNFAHAIELLTGDTSLIHESEFPMSRDDWQSDQPDEFDEGREDAFDEAYEHRPKPGMSTGMKILIILLVLCGGALAVCCGGAFFFVNKARDAMTQEPAKIRQIQEQITAINVPEDWQPEIGMNFTAFGTGMQMAVYKGDSPHEQLMLMQMQVSGANVQNAKQQFRMQAQQQGNEEIRIESTETKTFTINGEEVDFVFAKGTTEQGTPVREVTGTFPSRKGIGYLLLLVPEEEWDEEKITNLIQSIHE